jgi:hypothetical protein
MRQGMLLLPLNISGNDVKLNMEDYMDDNLFTIVHIGFLIIHVISLK